jgi:hypothetical protein
MGAAMLDPVETAIFAALGAAFALGVAILSRWSQQGIARVAAYALIAVAFLFVGVSLRAENARAWLPIELTGVAVFGSLGMMSVIGSPWFVVAGLALHPVWAIAFHYVGTGSDFTPAPFAVAAAAFDGALAIFTAALLFLEKRKSAASGALEPAPAAARAKTRGRSK